MGISVCPRIILGVNMSYLIRTRIEKEEFEIHDERGQKTGNIGVDKKTFYDIDYKGGTLTTGDATGEGLYTDEICDLINVPEEPNENKLGVFQTDYEEENTPDNLILGVKLIEGDDAMYGSTTDILNTDKLARDIEQLKKTLKDDFNCDIIPSLYLNTNVG